MREWWEQLAPRERLMVAVCTAFIVCALIWSLAIQPVYTGAAALEEKVASKQARLANLQELASKLTPQTGNQPAQMQGTNESIVVVIDRTTRSRTIANYLKRNQPEGDASVRLRFEDAPFDELIAWLAELKQVYGMVTVTANFDEAGPGRVNCSLVLSRPEA
jgi:general secretion pathway protein M